MQPTKHGFLESLGRQLDMGRFLLQPIEFASKDYDAEFSRMLKAGVDQETMMARLWDITEADKASKDADEWARDVRKRLGDHLDYSFVARFESDAGLTPAPLPDSITNSIYARRWRDVDMRLQRLHQIIEELSARWGV